MTSREAHKGLFEALTLAWCCFAGAVAAEAPLSAIDWLDTQIPVAAVPPAPAPAPTEEPDVAKTALVPEVTVQSLSGNPARRIGLVPPQVTGLPADLWRGSDLATLETALNEMPTLALPAAQSLFYTLLLAESSAPAGSAEIGDALSLAKVRALMARGALEPARALLEQAGVTTSPAHFDAWMGISLLTGAEDAACSRLVGTPHLTQDYGTRIFCSGRAGRWEDAALTFGSAQALGLLPASKLVLLTAFLDPETDATSMEPPASTDMDPLTFRLFETVGEPLPTRTLPRPFAVADLRDIAGWKAQLEAAERLTRAGALPDNRLLGLYTNRRPAASGGVWDRVAALQRFDTALASGSAEAVTKTLPPVWDAMTAEGLSVSFANLFATRLEPLALAGRSGDIWTRVQLLSPQYERMAATMAGETPARFIARGVLPPEPPTGMIPSAIYAGFGPTPPVPALIALAQQKRLGEAILGALRLLHAGEGGNMKALSEALATLRALGLEDTARRAALQLLLLPA